MVVVGPFVGIVAQCDPSSGAGCDIPTGLPWYFGLFLAVVWAAVVVGAVALLLRLVRNRLSSRRRRPDHGERRSVGSDVERW